MMFRNTSHTLSAILALTFGLFTSTSVYAQQTCTTAPSGCSSKPSTTQPAAATTQPTTAPDLDSDANQQDRLHEPSDGDSLRFAKAGAVVNIIKDKADLRTAFNNDKDKTRFITILSPT